MEKFFFEFGPQYSVALGDHPLSKYWHNGLGIGGSFGYFLRKTVAIIHGFSYTSMSPNGKKPIVIYSWYSEEIRLEEAQRSSVFEAKINVRFYHHIKNNSLSKNYFILGLSYLNERVGDLTILVENRFNIPGNDSSYFWSGDDHSRETIAPSIGAGAELFTIWELPFILEVVFVFPLTEYSTETAYIPIKARIRF
jgi:hypothetical protein